MTQPEPEGKRQQVAMQPCPATQSLVIRKLMRCRPGNQPTKNIEVHHDLVTAAPIELLTKIMSHCKVYNYIMILLLAKLVERLSTSMSMEVSDAGVHEKW